MRAAIAGSNVKPDEGDDWVRIGGMKLAVDGGFEGGWMREPYAEPWGEHGTFYGVNTMKQAAYTDVVKELNREGLARRHARSRRRRDRRSADGVRGGERRRSRSAAAAGRSSTASSRSRISFRG